MEYVGEMISVEFLNQMLVGSAWGSYLGTVPVTEKLAIPVMDTSCYKFSVFIANKSIV